MKITPDMVGKIVKRGAYIPPVKIITVGKKLFFGVVVDINEEATFPLEDSWYVVEQPKKPSEIITATINCTDYLTLIIEQLDRLFEMIQTK